MATASKVEALEGIARGMALDLLDAIGEVDSVGVVTIVANASNGVESITYMAMDEKCRTVFNHNLVGDEIPRDGEARQRTASHRHGKG